MAHLSIIAARHVYGVHSFTTGFVQCPKPKIKNENDALAYALWLEKHGFEREAEDFLNRYCRNRL